MTIQRFLKDFDLIFLYNHHLLAISQLRDNMSLNLNCPGSPGKDGDLNIDFPSFLDVLGLPNLTLAFTIYP